MAHALFTEQKIVSSVYLLSLNYIDDWLSKFLCTIRKSIKNEKFHTKIWVIEVIQSFDIFFSEFW